MTKKATKEKIRAWRESVPPTPGFPHLYHPWLDDPLPAPSREYDEARKVSAAKHLRLLSGMLAGYAKALADNPDIMWSEEAKYYINEDVKQIKLLFDELLDMKAPAGACANCGGYGRDFDLYCCGPCHGTGRADGAGPFRALYLQASEWAQE